MNVWLCGRKCLHAKLKLHVHSSAIVTLSDATICTVHFLCTYILA